MSLVSPSPPGRQEQAQSMRFRPSAPHSDGAAPGPTGAQTAPAPGQSPSSCSSLPVLPAFSAQGSRTALGRSHTLPVNPAYAPGP